MSEIISAARAANRDGTPRWRRVVSPLFVELHWLDGLTWRMLAMTLAIVAPTVIGNVIMGMQYGDVGMPPVLPAFVFEAFALPIVVAALLNLRRRALPLPVILIVAVLLVSLIGRGVIANVVYEGLPAAWSGPPLKKFFVNILVYTRQAAFLWGMAAAAWYFVRRASIREVALREAEVGRLRLDAGMLEARLRMMQAQVEPHFLFNTLAHVRRLYRIEPTQARLMLDRFCAYLRSALPQMRGKYSTLGREIDLTCAYLDVQRIRMGRRLAFEVTVSPPLRTLLFPPTMLISLTENAIKHGLGPLPEGGTIRIDAAVRDDTLHVSVTDNGGGFSKTKGSGVGLANIRARLAAIYGRSAQLTLIANAPRGVAAAIEIPLAHSASNAIPIGPGVSPPSTVAALSP